MRLASPWWVLLVAVVPVVLAWRRRRLTDAAVRYPSLGVLRVVVPRGGGRRRRWLGIFRMLGLSLLAVALGRPQLGRDETRVHREGVDIVLALDISGSMLAEDFTIDNQRVSRLAAVKAVVRDFVRARPDDRIGLVLFAGRPYTQSPLTLDHGWLDQNLGRAEVGLIEDGTAVGSAVATAVNRLRASTAPSKFVVLLTDGQSNAGRVTPRTAADAAAALGIKVYTIGAGTRGLAPYPATDLFGNKVYRPMPVDIDEQTLQEIAATTKARYFRATDTESLREIYAEIDHSEKAPFEAPQFLDWRELYPWFAWPALVALLTELTLGATWLRRLP